MTSDSDHILGVLFVRQYIVFKKNVNISLKNSVPADSHQIMSSSGIINK